MKINGEEVFFDMHGPEYWEKYSKEKRKLPWFDTEKEYMDAINKILDKLDEEWEKEHGPYYH